MNTLVELIVYTDSLIHEFLCQRMSMCNDIAQDLKKKKKKEMTKFCCSEFSSI